MLGNTIETDLIGELVEVLEERSRYTADGTMLEFREHIVVRGRVRAATAQGNHMCLWLEVVDDPHKGDRTIGNVYCTLMDAGNGMRWLRLIKQA